MTTSLRSRGKKFIDVTTGKLNYFTIGALLVKLFVPDMKFIPGFANFILFFSSAFAAYAALILIIGTVMIIRYAYSEKTDITFKKAIDEATKEEEKSNTFIKVLGKISTYLNGTIIAILAYMTGHYLLLSLIVAWLFLTVTLKLLESRIYVKTARLMLLNESEDVN